MPSDPDTAEPGQQSAAPPEVPASRAERRLLERLRAGDEAAFAELLEGHQRALRRLARTFVSSDASAEELVQETWIAVLDGLRRFEGRSSLKTWIFRILLNRARSRGVREARSVPISALGAADDEGSPAAVATDRFDKKGMWSAPPTPWENPEEAVLLKESAAFLHEALAQLPERQRTILLLRDVEGWSAEEVCNVLELNETNQRVLLHRARSRLRTLLEQHVNDGRRR